MNTSFLMEMLKTASPSGCEYELQKKIMAYAQDFADEMDTDASGNVYARLNTESPFQVMLCGHVDEIGLMVCGFTSEGHIRFIKSGGIRPQTYLGQKVKILTQQGIVYGAITMGSALADKNKIEVGDLVADIGAQSKEEAMEVVAHGDYAILETEVRELMNERITSRALDDKTGAFVVLEALRKAKEKGVQVGVNAVTTVGEETNCRGAYWASVNMKPTCAIAVDVTYASDDIQNKVDGDILLGNGPVLCHSPLVHPKLNEALVQSAKQCGIAIQWEAAGGSTYTDADKIAFTNQGVPVALVSIPLRYMHSPSEVGSLKDIQGCIDLLCEFLCQLNENFSFDPFI